MFYNSEPETSDVNWIDTILLTIIKVSEYKLGPVKYAQSMSKRPARSAYIGNFIDCLLYLLAPFPSILGIDLEGSSKFLPLMVLISID